MNATTSTTIQGVSILTGQRKKRGDAFELVLSPQGIEVRRPERPPQQMSWDRVSEWEIEERKGYVLLTLRGPGATTPLVVPGWTLDDLEVIMRDITGGISTPEAGPVAETVTAKVTDGRATDAVATPAAAPEVAPGASALATVAPAAEPDAPAPAVPTEPLLSRAERRQRAARGATRRRLSWRVVVTVVLLGVLATAVILVLLQSAGIIDWGFLGPVA